MLGQFLITFREALEAALLMSIVLAYLVRSGKGYYSRYIWYGVFTAVFASVIVGLIVWAFYGGLTEADTKLFEGIAALIAVIVLTSMILWMAVKGRFLKKEIQDKVDQAVKKGTVMALVGLAFVLIFREGFETVLFLTPFSINDGFGTMLGLALGLTSALLLAFIIFKVGKKIELKKFFYFSSLLLIFLAAGLLGYGIHELIEYQEVVGAEVGWYGQIAYDLGIAKDSIFYHKGAVGSVFAVMFGYSVKMEWGRVIAHLLYIGIFIPLTIVIYKKPELLNAFTKLVDKFRSYFLKRRNLINDNPDS
jgi:high-affinity iron transporter